MNQTADAVIIGGGCMGVSTAYHLARLGITRSILLERESQLGTGSTGRNAGGVRHQFSQEANVHLSIESINTFEHFAEEVGFEIDFHQDGYLFLLSTEEQISEFARSIAMQRSLGVDVSLISPDDAIRLAPGLCTEGILGASFCERDGICDPNGVTMGFAKAAQAAGVTVCRDTEVIGVSVESGKVAAVETDHGRIATPIVVNAAGPYAALIGRMAGVNLPILPFRRHIFITEPVSNWKLDKSIRERGLAYVPESRIMVIDLESTFYFHREGAGLLMGMSDPLEPSGFDLSINWEFLERMVPIAVRRLPALQEARIAHAWAGLYEVTRDAMPIIGPSTEVAGFYTIGGFSGHGFQHSPAAGRILAEMITGAKPVDFDVSAFSLDRFHLKGLQPELNVV
jgi:sarcosine oxidase subunit beta